MRSLPYSSIGHKQLSSNSEIALALASDDDMVVQSDDDELVALVAANPNPCDLGDDFLGSADHIEHLRRQKEVFRSVLRRNRLPSTSELGTCQECGGTTGGSGGCH